MKRLINSTFLAAFTVFSVACGGDAETGQTGEAPEAAPSAQTPTPSATPQQSTPEPMDIDPSILPEGVTVAMVEQGMEVFNGAGICYTCHTQGGGGGPLAPDLTDDTWLNTDGEYASIIEVVNTGVAQPLEHPGAMLPRAGMPLDDEQVAAVSAYVYTLSR